MRMPIPVAISRTPQARIMPSEPGMPMNRDTCLGASSCTTPRPILNQPSPRASERTEWLGRVT